VRKTVRKELSAATAEY